MPDHRSFSRALTLAVALAAPLAFPPAAAGNTDDRPAAVSPGHAARILPVDGRCPTFSWGQVPGADGYELVVYRVARDGEAAPVVLRAAIDGRAGSWTPAAGRCLEPTRRYAWSVRARRGATTSGWSTPALFEVTAGPSAAELDEALALVRQGAAGDGARQPRRAPGDRLEGAAGPVSRGLAAPRSSEDTAGGEADQAARTDTSGGGPGTGAPATTALSVDGRIEAGSFRGDGSELGNVEATGLSCPGCVSGAHLADGAVTAAKIGEACATGQVLVAGPAGWACATLTAPACTPGDQVTCYTGPDGTLGVGECRAGTRVCTADSSYGPCTGEVGPSVAEVCDGLDNTCDGAIDEGDATALCPPTANVATTLCDLAACVVDTCDPLWADADGEYANGCEAPAPGACLDAGVPRPIAGPGAGDLVIQEFLADPASPLTDAAAEWFEVAATAAVDLNDLGIGTAFGTVIDRTEAAECLSVEAGDLVLFARSTDPAANGGLAVDHPFSFSLVNGGGDLHLAYGGNLVDAVSWDAGDVEPGRARNLPPGLADATSNDDAASWCTVPADPALLYADGNHGTPAMMNGDCP